MTSEAPERRYLVDPPPPDIIGDPGLAEALDAPARRYLVDPPPPDIVGDPVLAAALQSDEPQPDDELPAGADPERPPLDPGPGVPLDNQAIYAIVREVARAESGDALYRAVSSDAHGLRFGLLRFDQASGRLGTVLRLMRGRDPETFDAIFGPGAEALVEVTGAATAAERSEPVDGEALSDEVWLARFTRAGDVPAFQAAQNEAAIEHLFRPALPIALGFGLATDRALALVFDRVVVLGLGAGLRWIAAAAGPLRTAEQRVAALDAVGAEDVAAFRARAGIEPAAAAFDVATHAALVAELRRRGRTPLPSAADLIGRMVAAADGDARRRLERLRDSAWFTDVLHSGG